MRRLSSVFLVFFFCGFSLFAQALLDAWGNAFDPRASYPRIVSLNPSVTEVIFALGAEARLVGVTDYCDWPAAAKQIRSVGGFAGKTVNLERILLLKPDLVIVSADMHQVVAGLLERAGIRCFAVEPRSIEDVFETMLQLGALSNAPEAAARLVAGYRARLSSLEAQCRQRERVSVFWQVWPEPLMTCGRGSLLTELMERVNANNIFDDLAEAWPTIGLEQVVLRQPDVIITDSNEENRRAVEAMPRHPVWSRLRAVRLGRVRVLDAASISRWGPRLLEAAQSLAEALQ